VLPETGLSPPDSDELEVTLLGRGVGESVVVHLLNNKWMIVDSCRTGKTPAAQVYLEAIGVEPSAVEILVVTHFHTDHYRGIASLHDHYDQSRLMVTAALAARDFVALYSDTAEPPLLGEIPATINRARKRQLGVFTPGLRHLSMQSQVYRHDDVVVMALSPTDVAVLQSNDELAQLLLSTQSRNIVESHLRDDNRCSVVLHVEAGGVGALLCGDIVSNPAMYGWQAILEEPNHQQLCQSGYVKVSHHGSETGHDDDMWAKLVGDGPVLGVAPYWPSSLPRPDDVERLCSIGGVWQAAPSVSFTVDEFGVKLSAKPETGVIQARRRVGEADWRVEIRAPAFFACSGGESK
jgi:beta-lactamase superfamily II metal-dependent hydrolase